MKTESKIIKNGREGIIVKYGINVTNHSYFSITATIGEKHPGRYSEPIEVNGQKFDVYAVGCCHEEIAKYFPQFADLIALHLSDVDGTPMHAAANSAYLYEQGKFDFVQSTLRLTNEQMNRVHALCNDPQATVAGVGPVFKMICEEMKPIWKAEADAAIAKHGLEVPAFA